MTITPSTLRRKAFEHSMRVLLAGHGIPKETATALAEDLSGILVDAVNRALEVQRTAFEADRPPPPPGRGVH